MKRCPADANVTPGPTVRALAEAGIYGPENGLRENTKLPRYHINFALNAGGLGDYINYSAATYWIAKNCPWVDGTIFVSGYLVQLIKEIHSEFPNWEVLPGEQAGKYIEPGAPVIGPEIVMDGRNMNPQLLNAVGAHLMDLGFAYYANLCPAPVDAMLPRLSFPESTLPPKVKKLKGRYVVIPTGSMTPSRWIEGKHLNPLIKYVKSKGLTPVFLGKKDVTGNGSLNAFFADDIAYDQGLDLRGETSVIGAATIMQYSLATVGLDCGLLHLAACMENSNVVFGYNIVEPYHRKPRRNWGTIVDVFLTREELACAGCQSRLKMQVSHTFHKCLYGDSLCVDLLFANAAKKFTDALDEVLSAI